MMYRSKPFSHKIARIKIPATIVVILMLTNGPINIRFRVNFQSGMDRLSPLDKCEQADTD